MTAKQALRDFYGVWKEFMKDIGIPFLIFMAFIFAILYGLQLLGVMH